MAIMGRSYPNTPILSRNDLQDAPDTGLRTQTIVNCMGAVAAAAAMIIAPSPIIAHGHQDPTDFNNPSSRTIVASQPTPTVSGTPPATFRNSLQDAPDVNPTQPIVVVQPSPVVPGNISTIRGLEDPTDFNSRTRVIISSQPTPTISGIVIVSQAPQAPVIVTFGPTTVPIVTEQPTSASPYTVTPNPVTIRSTLQDSPVLTTSPPIVVDASSPVIPGSSTVIRGTEDTSDFITPRSSRIIVTTSPTPTISGSVSSFRNTLQDPPVLTTPQPLVVSQPTPTIPGTSAVSQAPQPPIIPPSGATTVPVVEVQPTSASPYTVNPVPELIRNTLQDPPVLTTADPIVSVQPTPTIAGFSSISRTPLRPPNPVQPIVVVAPTKFPPDSVRILVSNPPPYNYVASPDPILSGVQGISFGGPGPGLGYISLVRTALPPPPPPPTHVGGTVVAVDSLVNTTKAVDSSASSVSAFDRLAPNTVSATDSPVGTVGAYDRLANTTGAFDYFL